MYLFIIYASINLIIYRFHHWLFQLLVNDFVHFALLKNLMTFLIIYFIYLINLVQY